MIKLECLEIEPIINQNELIENSESTEFPIEFESNENTSTIVPPQIIPTTNYIEFHQPKPVKSYIGITTYECYICPAKPKFAKQIQLEQHMKMIHLFYDTKLTDLLTCRLCNENFLSSSQLSRHKRKIHLGIIFKPKERTKAPCELCDKTFSTAHVRDRHINNVHKGERPFVCQICNKAFTQNSVLKNHIALVHYKERDYKCTQCEEDFSSKNQLVCHQIRRHMSDEEKLKLPPKKIKGKRTKEYHQNSKNSPSYLNNRKRVICEICGQMVSNIWIVSHMRIHDGSKPYKCPDCSSSFSTKRSMVLHRVMHKDDRPFKCDLCDKSFRRQTNLGQHKKRHTTEKPYKCLECNKAFAFPLNLRLHERTHSGEKPYKCNLCDENFSSYRVLQKHKNICQQ